MTKNKGASIIVKPIKWLARAKEDVISVPESIRRIMEDFGPSDPPRFRRPRGGKPTLSDTPGLLGGPSVAEVLSASIAGLDPLFTPTIPRQQIPVSEARPMPLGSGALPLSPPWAEF